MFKHVCSYAPFCKLCCVLFVKMSFGVDLQINKTINDMLVVAFTEIPKHEYGFTNTVDEV